MKGARRRRSAPGAAMALAAATFVLGLLGPAAAGPFLDVLLKIAGISASPIQQKAAGEAGVGGGDLWVVALDDLSRRQLTHGRAYRSPVFAPGDGGLLALQGQDLVRIPLAGGEAERLHRVGPAVKVVGVNREDPDGALLLFEQAGLVSLEFVSIATGGLTPLPWDPSSPEERNLVSHLRAWDRVHGATRVYVKSEQREDLDGLEEWTDVWVAEGAGPPRNVSACDGVSCGQPALSPDGRRVAYVRAAR